MTWALGTDEPLKTPVGLASRRGRSAALILVVAPAYYLIHKPLTGAQTTALFELIINLACCPVRWSRPLLGAAVSCGGWAYRVSQAWSSGRWSDPGLGLLGRLFWAWLPSVGCIAGPATRCWRSWH